MSKNIWSEIRSNYENEGIVHIDAWTTPNDNEEGTVIAKVDLKTGNVQYIDLRAVTNKYAQEVILEVLKDRENPVEEEFNVQGEVKPSDFAEEETGAPENFSDYEIREFKKEWGQTHVEICTNLGYSYSHGQSDELLMEDYFFLETNKEWYPKSSSLYTPREQAISDFLRYKN